MYITKIELENFRNYIKQEIDVSKDINIFVGNNAQGKTNIVESIYLSSIGKSFRTSSDEDMIRFGEEYFNVNILYTNNDKDDEINIRMIKGKHKQVSINKIKLDKLSQIIGNVKVVLFSPDELQVIKQSPAVRRRFIDISISQTKPIYLYNELQYNKVLAQRNSLIKQIKFNPTLKDTLDVWNEKIVKAGIELINARKEFIDKINTKLSHRQEMLSENKENLVLKYVPNCENEEVFLKKLEKNIDSDIARGYTGNGPHKDDYVFYINDKELDKYGSQGQQRSAILSYKLSEMDNLFEEFEERPILLLDDVTSELDKNRIEKLLQILEGYQTFITCTDIDNFETLKGYKLFNVENGLVKEVQNA